MDKLIITDSGSVILKHYVNYFIMEVKKGLAGVYTENMNGIFLDIYDSIYDSLLK